MQKAGHGTGKVGRSGFQRSPSSVQGAWASPCRNWNYQRTWWIGSMNRKTKGSAVNSLNVVWDKLSLRHKEGLCRESFSKRPWPEVEIRDPFHRAEGWCWGRTGSPPPSPGRAAETIWLTIGWLLSPTRLLTPWKTSTPLSSGSRSQHSAGLSAGFAWPTPALAWSPPEAKSGPGILLHSHLWWRECGFMVIL